LLAKNYHVHVNPQLQHPQGQSIPLLKPIQLVGEQCSYVGLVHQALASSLHFEVRNILKVIMPSTKIIELLTKII